MGVDGYWLERSFSVCGAQFVLLTHCTASYVFFRELLHFFPLVSLAKEMYGIRDTGMSHEGVIMVCL